MSVFPIRWMQRGDWPAVLEIEREAFEFPWDEEAMLDAMRRPTVVALVIPDVDDQPLAYVVYEIHARWIDLVNLAVRHDLRGRGLGKALVQKIVSKMVSGRQKDLEALVRLSNVPALTFLKRQGFQAVELLGRFYAEKSACEDDAVRMRYRWGENPHVPVNRLMLFTKTAGGA